MKSCPVLLWLSPWLLAVSAAGQVRSPSEHPAIAYSETAATDAIAKLQTRVEAGEASLEFDPARGYLPSVLRELEVPESSQALVFSRTSLQVDRIAPWTPRAIYFNDDVYVGWVQQGRVIEIASVDPVLGAVFYTLSQVEQGAPRFTRETGTCLMCHDSSSVTGGIPGFVVRSVYPDRYGYAIAALDRPTSDRTPFEERWGGWYVTGRHGTQSHLGNVAAPALTHEVGNVERYLSGMDYTTGGNVTDLSDRFDTSAYLTPHSDIVALLVLAHQASVHNAITRAGYETRRALYDEQLVTRADANTPPGPLTLARIERASELLVRALLLTREAGLSGAVEGTSSFAEEFSKRGPFDHDGRSLRQLDLTSRLFRYPLSFLIYSESFDALPAPTRSFVYRRIAEVLSGQQDEEFDHLTPVDRKALMEILSDTKPEFAAELSQASSAVGR